VDEIPIQCTVNTEINDFFAPVPSIVDIDVSFGDLESCWDPDTVHRDIDSCDENSNSDFKSHRLLAIGEE
jgi:hypothetical protein